MEYKWKTFSVTSVGSLMSAVDSTIVLLALVPIAEELNSDYVTMVWVVVAYILANTALALSLGRLGHIRAKEDVQCWFRCLHTGLSALRLCPVWSNSCGFQSHTRHRCSTTGCELIRHPLRSLSKERARQSIWC